MTVQMKIPFIITLLTFVYVLQLSALAMADDNNVENSETLFRAAQKNYENKNYEDAIAKLKTAVSQEPNMAMYHHLLAVCYGREAENANWFKAMDYAEKTLAHLEKSNELDPNNLEILDDLMDYYNEAPGFLGGDSKKADEIKAKIEKLTLDGSKKDKN